MIGTGVCLMRKQGEIGQNCFNRATNIHWYKNNQIQIISVRKV